ncbi:MAG: trypsin-like serine protease [Polyangia bacterium]
MRGQLLLLFMLSGCSVQAPRIGQFQSPIIGGMLDTGDPSVVLVYAQTSTTQASLCTGEVVSPHMVLTAAHCVDPTVLKTSSAVFSIFLGSDLNDMSQASDSANFIDVTSTDFDQQFDTNQLENGHDIGELSTAVTIPRALLPVHQTPLDDSFVDSQLRIVGFGRDSSTDTQGTSAGTRRKNTTSVTSVDSNAYLISSGDATHDICQGDSGGPGFITIGGIETIVGVASFVNGDCSTGTHTDVGAYYASFIAPHIAAAEAAAPKPVDMATPVVVVSDDASTPIEPTGGAAGAACSTADDCASGICASAGKTQYCSQACSVDDATTCPASMKCESYSGATYCVFPTKGGCSATGARGAPPGGSAGSLLLLLGLACVLRQRRRLG